MKKITFLLFACLASFTALSQQIQHNGTSNQTGAIDNTGSSVASVKIISNKADITIERFGDNNLLDGKGSLTSINEVGVEGTASSTFGCKTENQQYISGYNQEKYNCRRRQTRSCDSGSIKTKPWCYECSYRNVPVYKTRPVTTCN